MWNRTIGQDLNVPRGQASKSNEELMEGFFESFRPAQPDTQQSAVPAQQSAPTQPVNYWLWIGGAAVLGIIGVAIFNPQALGFGKAAPSGTKRRKGQSRKSKK